MKVTCPMCRDWMKPVGTGLVRDERDSTVVDKFICERCRDTSGLLLITSVAKETT